VSKSHFPQIAPRALTIRQAAEYWGVSPNTFRKLVRAGIAPGPLHVPGLGRHLFDREQQDRAIDALGSERAV
jgi:excisionase family DNA binding protein